MQTPKGNPSTKVAPGHTWKRHIRIEKAARLELAGLNTFEIAAHIGFTVQALNYLRHSPEYLAKRRELLTGVVAEYDKAVREDTDSLRGELRSILPTALLTLRNALIRGNSADATKDDRKMAFEAAKETLDREGSLAKVSKSSVSIDDRHLFEVHDAVTSDLLGMLNRANAIADQSEFVKASGDKSVQEQMAAQIKLEDFNSNTVQ